MEIDSTINTKHPEMGNKRLRGSGLKSLHRTVSSEGIEFIKTETMSEKHRKRKEQLLFRSDQQTEIGIVEGQRNRFLI